MTKQMQMAAALISQKWIRWALIAVLLPSCWSTPTWQTITSSSSPAGRYGHSSVAMNDGSIVVIGGASSSATTQRLTLRNDTAGVWTSLGNPYTSTSTNMRYGAAAFMPDGSMVYLNPLESTVHKLSLSRGTKEVAGSWTALSDTNQRRRRLQTRHGAGIAALPDGSLLVYGGAVSLAFPTSTLSSIGNYNSERLCRLTLSGATFSMTSYSSSSTSNAGVRVGSVVVVLPDDSLLVHGGWGSSTTYVTGSWTPTTSYDLRRFTLSGSQYVHATVQDSVYCFFH